MANEVNNVAATTNSGEGSSEHIGQAIQEGQSEGKTQSLEGLDAKGKTNAKPNAKDGDASTGLTKQEIRELAENDLDAYVKIKVNGKEERVKVRDLVKNDQIYKATEEKYQKLKQVASEANRYKFQLEELSKIAKADPSEFLKRLGVDPEEYAEATLTKKLQLLELSPEARENLELKQRLSKYEQDKQTEEQQKKLTEAQKIRAEYSKRLDVEITEAFKKSGLPKTRYYATRIPYLMMVSEIAAKRGEGEPLTAEAAASKVREEFLSDLKELIPTLELNQLREVLGDKTKALREDEIRQLQNQGQKEPKKEAGTPTKPREKKVFHTDKEYREWVASL